MATITACSTSRILNLCVWYHVEDDGDTTSFTFYEIIQSDDANPLGKGVMIAVYDRNATGLLAPFNGMTAIGTHEVPLDPEAFLTLWEW